MTWQEYQDAVGELYIQMEGIGTVHKNITLPDKVTGHPRQVDVWIEIESKGHKIGILVDAKFRKIKVDVKDVEEVLSLAAAVGANMSVLVALNGWNEQALAKANFSGLDLRLLTMDDALELIVPDKWMMCPICNEECIIADKQGGLVINDMWSLLIAGQCRGCKAALIWCWACGENVTINPNSSYECGRGHTWRSTDSEILIMLEGTEQWVPLIEGYDSLEEFASSLPEPDEPLAKDTDFYICKGIGLRGQGLGDQAIEKFNQAINLSPMSAVAYYQRAYTYDMVGYLEQAICDYSKTIELDATLTMAFASRGAAFYSMEKYLEAATDFRHFLSLVPDSPDRQTIQSAIIHAEREINNKKKR